jgi:hypothetical protein
LAGSVPKAIPHWPSKRRAKGVGDGGRRVLHQQGALQRQHHHLDDRTAAALEIAAIADLGL